jgi:hypothetical protein
MTMTDSHRSSGTTDNQPDELRLLQIYLRDHEAAAAGGLELFRRCAKSNEGAPYAAELQQLAGEVRRDRDALRDICRQFDVKLSKVGQTLALAGVTLGRLKMNGRIVSYSPLSRVIELEAMTSGVISKRRLWESLLHVADVDSRLDKAALARRAADADAQLETLHSLHERAVDDAFI